MNKDTMTGIIGALVLVTAMTGVFFYERGKFEEHLVSWEETGGDPLQANENLEHGTTGDPHTFNVTVQDALVSRVTIEVTWRENTQDRFRVEVTAPNGTTRTDERSGGQVAFEIPVQAAPAAASFADRDPDGALDQAWESLDEETRGAGQGDWTVRVTLVEALRPHEVLGEIDELTEEGNNSYDLTFTPYTWQPTAREAN